MTVPDDVVDELIDDISNWPKTAKFINQETTTDEQRADLAGTLNSVVAGLNEVKRTIVSEIHSDTAGKRWRYYIPGMRGKRSYNESALLTKIMEHMGDSASPGDAIRFALRNNLVKLQWQWSKLDAWAKKNNIELKIVNNREVGDGDQEDVGVIWEPAYPKYEPVEE